MLCVSIFLCEYQCYCFVLACEKYYIFYYISHMRKNWTKVEDGFLRRIVMEKGVEDWTVVAEEMRRSCEEFPRTGKQCRERWYNHLNPEVNKQAWSYEQSLLLFETHKEVGNRWKQISLKLKGRTDNNIKNHFYSTLRRSLRRLNKVMGEKNATHQMREIKPSVLTLILKFIYDNQEVNENNAYLIDELKDVPKLIFEFAEFKPVKVNIGAVLKEINQKKIETIFNLVEQFKVCYLNEKNSNIKVEAQSQSNSSQIGHPITHSEFKPQERTVNVLINASKENKGQLKTQAKEEPQFPLQNQQMEVNDPSPFTNSVEINANCDLMAAGSHWSPKREEPIQPYYNDPNLDEIFAISENP